jgi:hypothetical protein
MKRAFKLLLSVVLSAIFCLSSIIPVVGGPIQIIEKPSARQILDVQYRQRSGSNQDRSSNVRHRRPPPRNNDRRSRSNYWHGYRGSSSHRHGYRRRNDGLWFPAAAFATGAIVGSAASRPQTVVHHHNTIVQPSHGPSSRHIQWCQNRFRSYRVSDNTFQPYNGPRRQCLSPY